MQTLNLSLVFLFGTLIGSFLNVVIYRLPRGEKITGRSKCPFCDRTLEVWDLVPLFSYIFLSAKCRTCKQKISPRYPLVEALLGGLFAFAFYFYSPGALSEWLFFVKAACAIAVLAAIFFIDLDHFLILDVIVFPAGLFFLFFSGAQDFLTGAAGVFPYNSYFLSSFLAALLAPVPFFILWWSSKGTWMGFGDVKLAGLLGIILGFKMVWVCLLISIFLGGIISVLLLLFLKNQLKTKLPFGTFLSLGALFSLFYGPDALIWYLAILGF